MLIIYIGHIIQGTNTEDAIKTTLQLKLEKGRHLIEQVSFTTDMCIA